MNIKRFLWTIPASLLLVLLVSYITLCSIPSKKDLACNQRIWNGVWTGTDKNKAARVLLLFNNKSIDTNGKPIKPPDEHVIAQPVYAGPAPKSFTFEYITSDDVKFYQACTYDILFRQQWYPDGIDLYTSYRVYWKPPQAQQIAGYGMLYLFSFFAIALTLSGFTLLLWLQFKKKNNVTYDIENHCPIKELITLQNITPQKETFELTTLYPQISVIGPIETPDS